MQHKHGEEATGDTDWSKEDAIAVFLEKMTMAGWINSEFCLKWRMLILLQSVFSMNLSFACFLSAFMEKIVKHDGVKPEKFKTTVFLFKDPEWIFIMNKRRSQSIKDLFELFKLKLAFSL